MPPFLIEERLRIVAMISESFFGHGVSESERTDGKCITVLMPCFSSSSATPYARKSESGRVSPPLVKKWIVTAITVAEPHARRKEVIFFPRPVE